MATFPVSDDFIYGLVSSSSFTEVSTGSTGLSAATFPINNDKVNLDLFPLVNCPTLPTQGQVWPQGLFLGSYANLANEALVPPASTEFADHLHPVLTN